MINIERIRLFTTGELLVRDQSAADGEDLLLGGLLNSMAIAQLVVIIVSEFFGLYLAPGIAY